MILARYLTITTLRKALREAVKAKSIEDVELICEFLCIRLEKKPSINKSQVRELHGLLVKSRQLSNYKYITNSYNFIHPIWEALRLEYNVQTRIRYAKNLRAYNPRYHTRIDYDQAQTNSNNL